MLTKGKVKKGEGELVPYDPEIGHVGRMKRMVEEEAFYTKIEKYFHKAFYHMEDQVEQYFCRLPAEDNKEKEKEAEGKTRGNNIN